MVATSTTTWAAQCTEDRTYIKMKVTPGRQPGRGRQDTQKGEQARFPAPMVTFVYSSVQEEEVMTKIIPHLASEMASSSKQQARAG